MAMITKFRPGVVLIVVHLTVKSPGLRILRSVDLNHSYSDSSPVPRKDNWLILIDWYWLSAGERNGYNIPSVTPCPEVGEWLNSSGEKVADAKRDGKIPDLIKRLLGDAYLCFYQNLEVAMYKWTHTQQRVPCRRNPVYCLCFIVLSLLSILSWSYESLQSYQEYRAT